MASHWVNSSRHLPRERAGSSVILSIFLKIATLLLIAAFFAQPTAANPIKPLEAFTRNGGGLLDTSFSAGLLDLGGVNLGPLDTPQCKADAVRLGPEQVLGRRLLQTNDREKQKLNLLSEYLFTLGIALVGPASNVTGPNNAAVPLGEVLTIPGNPRFPQFDTLLGQNVSLSAVRLKKENFTGNGFKYDGNLGTGNFSFSIPGGGEFASSGNISGGGNFASSATCINLLATQDFTNTMENVTLVWYSLGVNQPFTTTRRIVSPIEALQVFQGDYPPTDGFPPPGTLGSGLEMFWPKLKQPIRFTFNKAPVGNITCARYDLSPNNDIGPDKTPVLTTWDVPNGGLQNVSCSEGEPVYTTENASALTDGYTPYGQTPFCQTWRLGAQLAFVFLTGNSGCEFDPALKYDRCLCPNYCSNKPCEPGCLRSVDPTGALANETISNRKSFKAPDSAQLCCNLTAPVCQEPWPVPTPNADKCCAGKNSTLFDGFCCCGPSKPDPPAWWIIFLVVISAVLFALSSCCCCAAGFLTKRADCDRRFEEVEKVYYVSEDDKVECKEADATSQHLYEKYTIRGKGDHCCSQNKQEYDEFHARLEEIKETRHVTIMEVECHYRGRKHTHKCLLEKVEPDVIGSPRPLSGDRRGGDYISADKNGHC